MDVIRIRVRLAPPRTLIRTGAGRASPCPYGFHNPAPLGMPRPAKPALRWSPASPSSPVARQSNVPSRLRRRRQALPELVELLLQFADLGPHFRQAAQCRLFAEELSVGDRGEAGHELAGLDVFHGAGARA